MPDGDFFDKPSCGDYIGDKFRRKREQEQQSRRETSQRQYQPRRDFNHDDPDEWFEG